MFSIKKVQKENNKNMIDDKTEQSIKSKVLYVITDRPKNSLINYFRESGLNVSRIFSDIAEARDTLLIQSEPCRMVIIDTGLGKFTGINSRKEIVDMIGLCDDDISISIFFTDAVIKEESKGKLKNMQSQIDWYKYISTASTVASIISYKETYNLNMEDSKDNIESNEIILNFSGLTTGIDNRVHNKKIESEIDLRDLRSHIFEVSVKNSIGVEDSELSVETECNSSESNTIEQLKQFSLEF